MQKFCYQLLNFIMKFLHNTDRCVLCFNRKIHKVCVMVSEAFAARKVRRKESWEKFHSKLKWKTFPGETKTLWMKHCFSSMEAKLKAESSLNVISHSAYYECKQSFTCIVCFSIECKSISSTQRNSQAIAIAKFNASSWFGFKAENERNCSLNLYL